jgi:hypothetical protein
MRKVDGIESIVSARITMLEIDLPDVVDCRDPNLLGINGDLLLDDVNYSFSHALAMAAMKQKYKGILLQSATRLGFALIVLPDNLEPADTYETMVDSEPTWLGEIKLPSRKRLDKRVRDRLKVTDATDLTYLRYVPDADIKKRIAALSTRPLGTSLDMDAALVEETLLPDLDP